MAESNTRLIAGCMTGTSLDGLDVALVEITGAGLGMTAKLHGYASRPLDALGHQLRYLAEGGSAPPIEYIKAARALGELHADAVQELCDKVLSKKFATTASRPAALDFVVAHGQTIWHAPGRKTGQQESRKAGNEDRQMQVRWTHTTSEPLAESGDDIQPSLSWQLFDPWPLVRRLSVPVCYDLRQADLIAGGPGAPITPLADRIMFREVPRPCAIVNLGGICNVTLLHEDPHQTQGSDVAPCNILLDTVVQRLFPDRRYDADGAIARQGRVVEMLHHAIVADTLTILKDQRSLGREQFPMAVIDQWLATARKYETSEDIISTYTAAVADLVGIGIKRAAGQSPLKQVILAGGGARNPVLVEAIQRHDMLGVPTFRTDDLGIACEIREAMAFAVLGALSQDEVPITLQQITGAKEPGRAGAWAYP